MTQTNAIYRKALVSTNPRAIHGVALAFNELGDEWKCQTLLRRAEMILNTPVIGVETVFGVDFAKVQAKLNEKGASPKLATDGLWGPMSKAALKAWQAKNPPLAVDGIPGPMSLASLGIPEAMGSASSTMGNVSPAKAEADRQAYEVAKRAAAKTGMTEKELQYVMTVARGEGHYGSGWGHPSAKTIELSKQYGLTGYEGVGSNNWGAVQGTGNAGSFKHIDTHADGSLYATNYRKYLTPEDGFLDMARIILNGGKRGATGSQEIKSAIAAGNLKKAVYAQHANGYFELAPEKYLSAVLSNYNNIMAGIKWPKLLGENGVTADRALGLGLVAMGVGVLGWLWRKQLFGV